MEHQGRTNYTVRVLVASIEKYLGVLTTGRNLNTIKKLNDMVEN